jgi:hypothetical protein
MVASPQAGVDLAGNWALRVVLEPRPDAGGRLTMPLTANVEQVKLVATAGGWRIEIPGPGSTRRMGGVAPRSVNWGSS